MGKATGLTLIPHAVALQIEEYRITRAEIAGAYGCEPSFVSAILARRNSCPARMIQVIRDLIAARRSRMSEADRRAG